MFFLIYGLIPFILFVIFHVIYIFIGIKISKILKHKPIQIFFCIFYGAFGFTLIYTDLIWKEYTEPYYPNHYSHYEETHTSKYKYTKVNIHGTIDPSIDIVLSTILQNKETRCIKDRKSIFLGKKFEYPMIKTNQYDVDIFMEYIDKKTNCKYTFDTLSIKLYKPGIKEPFYWTYLFTQNKYYKKEGEVEIVCTEKDLYTPAYTDCKRNFTNKAVDSNLESVRLDVRIDEQTKKISGLHKEDTSKGFFHIFSKFQSLTLPLINFL